MARGISVLPPERVRVEVSGANYVARVSTNRIRVTVSTNIERVDATRYVHEQPTPATTWSVVHNLGRRPLVDVILSDGRVVGASVIHLDDNSLNIYHNSAASGSAVLT